MPGQCRHRGLHFQYPDNWALETADARDGCDSIGVQSPGGAFWTVSRHPSSADPHRLASAALEAMQEEYETVESYETHENIAGHETVGYDINFYCLDLTNTAKVRCLRVGRASYTLFFQAEDREFAAVEPVFRAISFSLLTGLNDEDS